MGRIPTDLSTANLIKDNDYVGNVVKLEYQIKTGDSWNQEGTETVNFEEFSQATNDKLKRLHYTISVPDSGKGNIFHDLYMQENCAGFMLAFMKACNVEFDADGYDPDDAIGKQVNIEVTTIETEEWGYQNNFKFSKV